MDNWKKELKQAFELPEPYKKKEFIKRFPRPQMRTHEFLLEQAGYIRPWSWCVFALTGFAAIAGAMIFSQDMLGGISAMAPILALTIVAESGRAECYRMSELEMTARFSLKYVMLARMGILGILNTALFLGLIPLSLMNNEVSLILAGLSVMMPFLLTTFFGLWVVRRFRGREGMYLCIGISCFVSIFTLVFQTSRPVWGQRNFINWGIAGTLVLTIGTIRQFFMLIKGTEELSWN